MLPVETDLYTPIVSRFMHIDETTWGTEKSGYVVRYRGHLVSGDSVALYDQLSSALRPLNLTPLFRLEQGRHAIILVQGVIQPKRARSWANLLFFFLTVLSVMFAGALTLAASFPSSLSGWLEFLLRGLPFAAALLTILLFHEFGHYLAGRFHKTEVTLPFFIPFPLSYFGTMGAFIQLKEPPKNRRVLLDIGLAGPISGLLIAIPILIYGLSLSEVSQIPFNLPAGQLFEGNSILYLFLKYLVKGQLLPQPFNYDALNPVLHWVRYFFTGLPVPRGGIDVTLHPVAWAGWAGLLVTSLNLIPAGQLDGGHIMYVLLGKYTNRLLPFVLIGLLLLGFVWEGWFFWALLIFFLGRSHAEPLDQITPLDAKRRALAILGVVVFLLVFMPVPLS